MTMLLTKGTGSHSYCWLTLNTLFEVHYLDGFLLPPSCREAGIPEMLDVDDMLAIKIPDAKSIMTFLVTIYQHFNS